MAFLSSALAFDTGAPLVGEFLMTLVSVFFKPSYVAESSGGIFQRIYSQYIHSSILTSMSHLILSYTTCHGNSSISASLTVEHRVFHACRRHLRIILITTIVHQHIILSDISEDVFYWNFSYTLCGPWQCFFSERFCVPCNVYYFKMQASFLFILWTVF